MLPVVTPPAGVRTESVRLHGEQVAYRTAGTEGPVIVLLHGMASTSATFDPVLTALGESCIAIAPDLLGSGNSAKPPLGDYSLGAYASSVRDLLSVLGHDSATIIGHSLGGGVALQFAYQFPERCERLVLVSSGGLGPEVHPILRVATMPGFDLVLRMFAGSWMHTAGLTAGRLMRRVGLRPGTDVEQSWSSLVSLGDAQTRAAFLKTVRSVIAANGQRVSAVDRLYLAAAVPTLLVWGDRDHIIPVAHAEATHALIPDSRLKIVPGAGHYPHRDDPEGFTTAVLECLAETECAQMTAERWRELLLADAQRRADAAQ